MAAGIQDLGNGLGYIYKTKTDGTTIVGVERNTNQGAQAMIQNGVGTAPIAAQRSAYSVLTVTLSGGVGSITNIDINGVNQIAAPIVVTSVNTNVVADQIVAAINSYSAPGFAFTANKPIANQSFIYIYSAPADGVAVNGLTPVISVSGAPGLLILAAPFINGSNDSGVYDDQFGYRFWLDAQAGASPNTISGIAYEITKYLVLRGSNAGIITTNKTIQPGGSITNIGRACDTTQIILDTGGPASAVCGFIETIDFVEGDTLRIRNAVPSRVTTIEDASVNTSSPSPNIYLSNQSPFALTQFNSITLQYRYDSLLGPIWIETGRSISNSPISTTFAQFQADAIANNLTPGARYFITDLLNGLYTVAMTGSTYEPSGIRIRYIPAAAYRGWRSGMAAPFVGEKVRYYNLVYTSITGAVGSAPSTDVVNWLLVSFNNTDYTQVYHDVILTGLGQLSQWPVLQETDSANNVVRQDYKHFTDSGVNAYNVFRWSTDTGSNQPQDNIVENAVFDIANSDGLVVNNYVNQYSNFSNNTIDSSAVISYNTITNQSTVTGNNFRSLTGNYVNYCLVQNNFNGANKAPNIEYNVLNQSYIISNFSTGTGAFIRNNILSQGSAIQLNTMSNFGVITNNTLTSSAQIQGCILLSNPGAPGNIGSNIIQNCTITYTQYAPADISSIQKSTFNNSSCNFYSNVGSIPIIDSVFNNSTFNNWQIFGANQSYFDNCSVTAQLDCQFFASKITNWISASPFVNTLGIYNADVFVGAYSNLVEQLDLNDPLIYAANVLTVPYNNQLAGIIYLIDSSGAASKTIDQIINLPFFADIKFYNLSNGITAITFNVTAPGAWTGNEILGAANFTLNGHATGVSDYMAMNKYQGVANMITTAINF